MPEPQRNRGAIRRPLPFILRFWMAVATMAVTQLLAGLPTPAAATAGPGGGPALVCSARASSRDVSLQLRCQAQPCSSAANCGRGNICVSNFCGRKSCCVPVKKVGHLRSGKCKKLCPVSPPGSRDCAKCAAGGAGQDVCGQDGRTYSSACAAEQCGGTTVRHPGPCMCDITTPAASCKALGEECTVAANGTCPCCHGLICWSGPVARLDDVLGSCRNASGPLPIGR